MEVGEGCSTCFRIMVLSVLVFHSARPTPVFRDEKILGNEAATHCAEVSFVSCGFMAA